MQEACGYLLIAAPQILQNFREFISENRYLLTYKSSPKKKKLSFYEHSLTRMTPKVYHSENYF